MILSLSSQESNTKKKIRISYFIETKNGSKIHNLRHLYLSFLVEHHYFSSFGIIQSCLFCSLGLTLGKITHEDKIKGLLPKFTFKIFIYNKNKSTICIFLFFQTEISSYLDFVWSMPGRGEAWLNWNVRAKHTKGMILPVIGMIRLFDLTIREVREVDTENTDYLMDEC